MRTESREPEQSVGATRPAAAMQPLARPVAMESQDIDPVASMLGRAFRDNPMNRAVVRCDSAETARVNRFGALSLLGLASRGGQVLVETASDRVPRGAIIGFSPDFDGSSSVGERLRLAFRQGLGVSLRWGDVHRVLQPLRPAEPHWTLSMVGVEPHWQGKGLGRQLVDAWLEQTDRARADVWVETDRAELVAFYRGFGFEPETESGIFGVTVYGLRRPAAE